ncbi:MAG: 3-oxoadipate enol-lactonase [Amycolatopsis sp.]|uniref:3-oxoadipate enol-lactonase n=1 Tax=Amycolatopsis sp. TaxID=37632 RepID=UPI0026257E3F|nr:3-oxoadipate enol-lactonase [Amycolatopsis sp.]MCU1685036.1 3-oxoadipate enol-lactonase [Amycolatopsis sp.]
MTVEVHRVVEGQPGGEAVVLSGSLGSDLRMWDSQAKALSDHGFRVIRYDHRGHGDSPVPPGPYSLGELAGDLFALLDSLDVARAHIVGLSLGGMTGMWAGAHSPDRVASLVLCCTSAKLGPAEMWADRALTVRARGTGSIAEAVVARWLTPAYAEANPDRVSYFQEMVTATPDDGYAECCGAIERMDLTADLAAITAPTLVIAGAEDRATPPEHGRRIAAGIPDARLEIVDGAAHLGNVEQPSAFIDLILGHLKSSS